MIPYRDKKIKNAVAFFASQHKRKAKQPPYQTHIYKYLSFLDFYSLRETGQPVLELTYKAMKRGPVPIEIYENKKDTDKYRFIKDEYGERVVSIKKPNLDYFSDYELSLMERLVEIFAKRWVTTNIMSDSSHEEIKAWRITWRKKPNSIIDYKLEFDKDPNLKTDEELTFPEEVYLTRKALMA